MLTAPPIDESTLALIRLAVAEDLGLDRLDRTVALSIPPDLRSQATIVARQPGVIAGTYLLPAILSQYGPGMDVTIHTSDGSPVAPNQAVAQLSGPAGMLLSAERVVLNFLSHLSGIATLTRRYVDAVAHLPRPPAICDTRKTTPGFRRLDKYAVACGGGVNHRMGLYDGVMLKDNHLAMLRQRWGAALSLAALTARIRAQVPPTVTLWLEVDTLSELQEALPGGGADIILLDNMTPAQMTQAVALRNAQAPRPLLEASGGITLANIAAAAASGIERISIGALTHSAPILDLSMEAAE